MPARSPIVPPPTAMSGVAALDPLGGEPFEDALQRSGGASTARPPPREGTPWLRSERTSSGAAVSRRRSTTATPAGASSARSTPITTRAVAARSDGAARPPRRAAGGRGAARAAEAKVSRRRSPRASRTRRVEVGRAVGRGAVGQDRRQALGAVGLQGRARTSSAARRRKQLVVRGCRARRPCRDARAPTGSADRGPPRRRSR